MTDEYHNMMVDKDKEHEGQLRGNVWEQEQRAGRDSLPV
jgi:hypothetical protein